MTLNPITLKLYAPTFHEKPIGKHAIAVARFQIGNSERRHTVEFYDRKLAELAPDWKELLTDSQLLLRTLDRIEHAGDGQANAREKRAMAKAGV